MSTNHKTRTRKKPTQSWIFFLYIPFVNKTYTLKDISKNVLIKDLQKHIEIICGIPTIIQRLHYLDMADLPPGADLYSLDIVNKATFILKVFQRWERLVTCVYNDDMEGLLNCNISTAKNKDVMLDNQITTCADEETKARAEVALYLASHLGNVAMIQNILKLDVDINCRTKHGYTPLHACIANGQYNCMDFLLGQGAKYNRKSSLTKHILEISKHYGHTKTERHLLMYEWHKRSQKKISSHSNASPLMMHQQYDSKYPTWFRGPYSTKYFCCTLPKGEFSGTKLNAPKTQKLEPLFRKPNVIEENETSSDNHNDTRSLQYSRLTYEKWIQQKKSLDLMEKHRKELELLREKEQEEKERKFVLMKSLHRRENEQRKLKTTQEDCTGRNNKKKTAIYEDYSYVPSYERTILHQMLGEISI